MNTVETTLQNKTVNWWERPIKEIVGSLWLYKPNNGTRMLIELPYNYGYAFVDLEYGLSRWDIKYSEKNSTVMNAIPNYLYTPLAREAKIIMQHKTED